MNRLQKLFASSPQGIIFTNGCDEITHWSPAAENIFGLPSREALGKKMTELIGRQGPDLAARWNGGKVTDDLPLQGKVVSTSGEVHLVEFLIGASEVDDRGEPFKLIIANDISHQWLREEQLQKALRLQTFMETILHVAMLNASFQRQLEMLLELILTIPGLHVLPVGAILLADGSPERMSLKVKKGLSGGRIVDGGFPVRCNCFEKTVEEEVIPQECNLAIPAELLGTPDRQRYPGAFPYPIPLRSAERLLGFLVIYLERPITGPHPEQEIMLAAANVLATVVEREVMRREQLELIINLKTVNRCLNDEKKFSESIIASLLNGLLILDNDEKVVACNPEGRRLLGHFYSGEPVGRQVSEILGEDLASSLLFHEGKSRPDVMRKTVEATTASGEPRLIEYLNYHRLDEKGEWQGSIISFSDITEADRLLRKMEKMNRYSTIAEIASAVAHEVRNPLAGIKAISQGVESQLAPEDKNRQHLSRINNQVDRLNHLLTDFFTYARPPKPMKKPVHLRKIIDQVIALVQAQAGKSSIAIDNLLGEDLPLIVVDPNQMQQVFLNLFLNALESIKGPGVIEVGADVIGLARDEYNERRFPDLPAGVPFLVMRIRDSGRGMAPEVQAKLFEPFFTSKTTGTGLGLAIVMRIMREHHAYIYAESSLQKGSTFFLFFRTE